MNLIEKTNRLNIRLDDAAKDSSNTSLVSLAKYRNLVNLSTQHVRNINMYLQFPIEFNNYYESLDEFVPDCFKRLMNDVQKGKTALESGNIELAKIKQQNVKRSLESLEQSANSIYRKSLGNAKLEANKSMKSKAEFDFICRSLPETLKQELYKLHRILDRSVVDDNSIYDLGGSEFKRVLERYTEIILENQVELPDEVSVFMKKVRDKFNRTTLKDLSPEVLVYLLEHDLASDFVITPTKN